VDEEDVIDDLEEDDAKDDKRDEVDNVGRRSDNSISSDLICCSKSLSST